MNSNELFQQKDQFYLKPTGMWQKAIYAAIAVGLVLIGFGFTVLEARTVWGTLLFNCFFFFCLGLGLVPLSVLSVALSALCSSLLPAGRHLLLTHYLSMGPWFARPVDPFSSYFLKFSTNMAASSRRAAS